MARYNSEELRIVQNINKSYTTPSESMPISGIFGDGNVKWFGNPGSYQFTIPSNNVRVRLWGGGSAGAQYLSGCGGGFAMKTIEGLTVGDVVTLVIGAGGVYNQGTLSDGVRTFSRGGTSSFGLYVSATGGEVSGPYSYENSLNDSRFIPGIGIGGDINHRGGLGAHGQWYGQYDSSGAGGAASLLGNGGDGVSLSIGGTNDNPSIRTVSNMGGGGGANGTPSGGGGNQGGNGGTGSGGFSYVNRDAYGAAVFFKQPEFGLPGLDFIGTGGGGANSASGINGGGAGGAPNNGLYPPGGLPGGGSGRGLGGPGLVIVEW